jgi:uncharacterized protein (DUF4415 family)
VPSEGIRSLLQKFSWRRHKQVAAEFPADSKPLIRLDAKVVEYLRDTGKGWQTRVNAELAKAVKQGRL